MVQGEVVVARFTNWPPDALGDDNGLFATLLFGDGSQKMLAAMTCWVAMLLCWRHHGSAALDDKIVSSMVASFLNIQTIVKATDCRGSQLESVINRIVQQNVAAKVQPITSFGWSSILRSASGSAERVQQTTFEEALQCYNNHPDVVSHDRADSGSGSIALDGRKRQGVRTGWSGLAVRPTRRFWRVATTLLSIWGHLGKFFPTPTFVFCVQWLAWKLWLVRWSRARCQGKHLWKRLTFDLA